MAARKLAVQQSLTAGLDSTWKQIIGGSQDSVDIAVYDHVNGETAHYANTAATFNTASIVKLSILEDMLLQDQKQGETLTGSQLAEAQPMIENSDNDAATALWNLDGGTGALDSFFRAAGATQTAAGQADYWGLTQTTAPDQLKIVDEIAYPSLLNTGSVSTATNLLDNVEPDQAWGVSSGVPSGVSVQLKDGWLQGSDAASGSTWDVNSIGHVHGDGQDYTIAVLTANDATEQDGIDTIQSLSAATWNALSAVLKS
ncbi:MAG: serine hydrolase [Candidatus Saccharibacteria bacterium]